MRRGTLNDLPLLTNVLTKAFWENKSVNYVVRQDKHKLERMKKLMRYSIHVCLAAGEIWISNDEQACALILFSDKNSLTLKRMWWDVKLAFSVVGLNNVIAVTKREALIKKNHPKASFCHLWFIGVNPEMQTKGKGSALLQHVIQECEKRNKSIYLETSVELNLEWYKKFGFEIFNTIDLNYRLYQLRLCFK